MRDVASVAGVSHQTVSRVINNSPNVKKELRDKVQMAIDDLGYVPNIAARRMGGNRSYLILAINDRARTLDNWNVGRGNDWVDQMLFGGMMECEKNGFRLIFELVDTEDPAASKQLARAIASLRPDGVILTPPHSENQDLADLLSANGTAFARLGSSNKDDGINIAMDDKAAARAATQSVLELNHRKVAFVAGSSEYLASVDRLEGYREAMAEAGAAIHPDWEQPGDFSFESGTKAAANLFNCKDRPTAVIASNDEMAFALLHEAAEFGIAVPEELSIISFDDTPGVRFSVPPLTAIRQPISAMAQRAASELMNEETVAQTTAQITLPFELIVRGSTGPVPR
ncbi:substrate-binding domain-containing protein [Erythrobacter sp. Alg231-14]|uniref:substrate-binding domain-containing protein n=1 Tax=Erythrobacter sp. Alg231-14 TaxID=1922225 RepID=UPI000D54CF57